MVVWTLPSSCHVLSLGERKAKRKIFSGLDNAQRTGRRCRCQIELTGVLTDFRQIMGTRATVILIGTGHSEVARAFRAEDQ